MTACKNTQKLTSKINHFETRIRQPKMDHGLHFWFNPLPIIGAINAYFLSFWVPFSCYFLILLNFFDETCKHLKLHVPFLLKERMNLFLSHYCANLKHSRKITPVTMFNNSDEHCHAIRIRNITFAPKPNFPSKMQQISSIQWNL